MNYGCLNLYFSTVENTLWSICYISVFKNIVPSPQFLLKEWAQAEKNVPYNLTALASAAGTCNKFLSQSKLTHVRPIQIFSLENLSKKAQRKSSGNRGCETG